jgi:hypothetical protein
VQPLWVLWLHLHDRAALAGPLAAIANGAARIAAINVKRRNRIAASPVAAWARTQKARFPAQPKFKLSLMPAQIG